MLKCVQARVLTVMAINPFVLIDYAAKLLLMKKNAHCLFSQFLPQTIMMALKRMKQMQVFLLLQLLTELLNFTFTITFAVK